MPNIFESLAAQDASEAAPAAPSSGAANANAFENFAQQEAEAERRRLSGVLGEALKANPDQAAQTQKLAQASGLPVDTVERNADEVARQERLRRTDTARLMADSPILARQLMDPDFAKVAHDDVGTLHSIEQGIREFRSRNNPFKKDVRDMNDAERLLNSGTPPVVNSEEFSKIVAHLRDSYPMMTWDDARQMALQSVGGIDNSEGPKARPFYGTAVTAGNVFGGIANSLTQSIRRINAGAKMAVGDWLGMETDQARRDYQSAQADEALTTPDIRSREGRLVYGGAANIAKNSPGVVLSILTGNPVPGLAAAGAQTSGEAYGKYRLRGATAGEAALGAGLEGAVEVGTEMLPMGSMVKAFNLKSGVVGEARREFLKSQIEEQFGEQVATHLQDAIDTAIANPDKTWGEYWKERPDAALQTAVATIMQSGVLGSVHYVATRGLRQEAAYRQEFFNSMVDGAASSKLRERMPERFQRLVEDITKDGPVENVYIPAEKFNAYFQSARLDPALVAEELGASNYLEASVLGGDLVIPTSRFATLIAGTEHYKALSPNLRLSPGELTTAEATELNKDLPARIEELTSLLEEQEAPDTNTSQQVYEDVLGQLIGMGRDRSTAEQEATLYKQVFNAIASRTGQDPLALYQRYQLRINRQQADILSQRPNVDHLDPLLDALRADRLPSDGDIFGKSLLSALGEAGGLAPDSELTARDAGKARPGLIRNDGMTLDAAREWAQQNGYINDGTDLNAFIDLIDQELRGQPAYAMGRENAALMGFRDAAAGLRDHLDSMGIDYANLDNASIKQRLQEQGAAGQVAGGGETLYQGPVENGNGGRSMDEVYTPEAVDFLEAAGVLTPEQAAQYRAAYEQGVARDVNATAKTDEVGFLSNASTSNRYSDASPLLRRIRQASNRAVTELRGSPERTREVARPLGPFSGYRVGAQIVDADSLHPDGHLRIELYGKEQLDEGLTGEPALLLTVSKDGELVINGPDPTSDTFKEFQSRGWAEMARGQDGKIRDGWTVLTDPQHPDQALPVSQLMPLLADVHARLRVWRNEDKVGIHWSRTTGATGDMFGGRSTAVYFQDGDYRGNHRAPGPGRGASLDDLTSLYGDEIYSKHAAEYFGHFGGGDALDKATARLIKSLRGKPDAEVTIYRAVPSDLTDNAINPGDWVTINRDYAVDHGEGALEGKYRILEKTVKARDLYTNGDSIHEFGYAPAGDTTLYQFAGARARTANVGTLEEAKARLAKGEFPGRVRRETGWFRGVDGQWRFEIPDDEAKFIEPPISMSWKEYFDSRKREKFGKADIYSSDLSGQEARDYEALLTQAEEEYNRRNGRRRLADVLDHPKLFAAYPDLANVVVGFRQSDDFRGAYYPQADLIELNVDRTPEEMLSTLLHEVQHAIQHREGFATGGNLDAQFVNSVKAALGDLHNRSQQEAEQWKWQNKYKVDSYKEAAQVARYGLMYESAQRLIEYANRESPSGVLRLIRNEIQWIYTPELRDSDVANEIGREFYLLPKRHKMRERNEFLSDLAFKAGRMLMDHIPAEYRDQFKADTRTMKGMLKALQREAERKNRELQPLHDLQKKARAAAAVADEHRFSGSFEIYQSLAGEVEARNTQARQKMTAAERQDTAPELTQDAPNERIVVMFGGRDIQAPMTMASTIGEGANGKPVATLKGTEIAPADADLKALRQAAADYYQQHLAGHAFHNDTLGDINFAKRGLKKAIATSANPAKLRLFAALPELLQHGRYLGARPNAHLSTHRTIKAYHHIAGTVMMGDSPVEVQVTVEEHNDGKFYYNHTLPGQEYFQEEKGGALTSDAIQARGVLPETERQVSPEPALPGTGSQLPETSVAPGHDVLNIVLRQEPTKPRGQISFGDDRRFSITLLEKADLSTFLHESGHFFLEVMADAAEAENASEQVKADWQTILNWMGVQSRDQIGTEQHERWARGFEAYLREGKAPSMELQSAFSRFRAWLTHIYKTLSQLNVKLTPQVREVMDRLVASDEEIARAERPFQPIFATALDAGMTEQEFAVYRKYAERAHQEAGEQVTKRLMAELSREQRLWWREELDRVRSEVTAEVNALPAYQLLEFLQHGRALQGELPDGLAPVKLDREALVQMYGPEFLKRLPRPYVYGKDGVHPDVLAPVFGFDSGDALVMAMANARPRKALIEAEAKQRMLEAHGDLMNDGGLADRAQAAVQNEYRGKVLRAELVAMAKKRREAASAVRQAVAEERKNAAYAERWKDAERKAAEAQQREARQAAFDSIPPLETFQKTAQDLINGKALRDIRPHLYLMAERKAYGLATEKASKGHYDEAVQAQQQALLNHFLYREATKAMDEAERVYRYFRKLEKRTLREKIGRAGDDYLEQLDALLAQYEFRRVSGAEIDRRQETLREFAARKLLDSQEVIEVPERMPTAKNYRELTISELLGVHDLARNIATVALEKFQATIMGKKLDIDAIAGAAADEILTHSEQRPLNKDLTNSVTNALRRSKDFLAAELIRPEMFLELTGSQTLLDVVTTAQDRLAEKNLRLVEVGKRLREAFRIYSAKQRLPLVGELYQKRTLPELNGYTVSKIELLMMALNWGNLDNRIKLVDGRQGWTEAGVQVVLNKYLTQDDWNLVQTVWDEMEALWPEIAALERRTVGLVPAKVDAAEVVTPFGTYRGGYFPIAYDTSEFATGLFYRQTSDEQMSTGYARRYTRNGHTNERVKSTGKPILLDPRVISRHFDQVLHDLYMREVVQDMHKVFSHPQVQEALESTAGADLYRSIRPWINRIAGDVQQPGGALTSFLRFGRSAVTAAGLGFNILNSLQNLASIPAVREYVGGKRMAAALTDFTTSPKNLTAQMLEKSVFMRARGNTYHTDIRDATRGLDPASPATFFKEYAYWLNGKTQFVVDSIAWHAAYQQALDGKAENIPADDDARAVAYADHVVRQTQGGGQAIDLPQVQSYGELSKALTMFYGYFSTQGNLFYRRARLTGKQMSEGQYRKAIIGASSTLLITWFIQQLLAEAVMDPPDDDDEWLKEKSLRVAWFPAQFVPGARDVANYVQNPQYGYSLSPVGGVFESAGRSVLALNKAVHGEDLGRGDYKAIFETLGAPFQLPTRQMERSGEALLLWMTGEDQPTGPVDAFYDFSKGPKRR